MNISIRDVNPEIFRRLKAEAVKEGIKVGSALTQAVQSWLKGKEATKKKKRSFFDMKPWDWGPGNERVSVEIDEILYGGKL